MSHPKMSEASCEAICICIEWIGFTVRVAIATVGFTIGVLVVMFVRESARELVRLFLRWHRENRERLKNP